MRALFLFCCVACLSLVKKPSGKRSVRRWGDPDVILNLWLSLGALHNYCPSLTKRFGACKCGDFFNVLPEQIVVTGGAYGC